MCERRSESKCVRVFVRQRDSDVILCSSIYDLCCCAQIVYQHLTYRVVMAQQKPVIVNIAFDEMFPRMAQCGYRHVIRAKEDITALRSLVPSITAHLAQVTGHPPLFMVKGPLLNPNDLRGHPQVEFVVTLTQAYPNSYPIITIEGPPQSWSLKRHPNVDANGCCCLQSVSRWNPQSSRIVPCIQELQAALRANHPFQSAGGTSLPAAAAVAPAAATPAPQPPRPVQQQPQSQPPPQPQCTASAPVAPVVEPLGAQPQFMMPPQTLAVGTMIFGAGNASNGRTDPEILRQRERDQRWLAEYQARQQVDPANRAFVASAAKFHQMICGQANQPNTVVDCPLGFGFNRIQTAADVHLPLRSLSGVPAPLPPSQEPTPDEQYRVAEEQKAVERARREAVAQSAPKSTGAFGGLGRALNIGAAMVGNLASQAVSSVESEVRKSEAAGELRRFTQLFPQFVQEKLAAEYNCSALMGNGIGVYGQAYITDFGVHFTTKRVEGVQPPIVFQFDISFNQVASIVKGSADSFDWIHLVYDDGQFRSLYNVNTSTAAQVGEYVSSSLRGSAYTRMYTWLDHKWRAKRFAGASGFMPPPPAVSAVPMPPQESEQCAICMERPKNQFFQPCGHVCCCQVCVKNVRDCPLCRSPIQQAFQAFL